MNAVVARQVLLVVLGLVLVVLLILAGTAEVEQVVRTAVDGEPTPARIEEIP